MATPKPQLMAQAPHSPHGVHVPVFIAAGAAKTRMDNPTHIVLGLGLRVPTKVSV